MSKQFFVVIAAVIVGLGAIFWFSNKGPSTPTRGNSNVQPSNHIFGSGKKGVTLLEYGDYQCPACEAYYPVVKQVVNKYQADIFFQFRNFPLTQIHQNAFAGARAAEAAGLQGKYFEMHDLLYDQQSTWSVSTNPLTFFQGYAQQLGLDVTKFNSDYSSSAVNDIINADINAGNAIGVNATPTFVLDGQKVDKSPQSLAAFDKLIADEITAKNK